MKKYFGLLAAVTLSLAILGACGTNTNKQDDTQVQTQAIAEEQSTEAANETAENSAAASNTVQNTERNASQDKAQNAGTNNNESYISEDEAKEIALEHAALAGEDVDFVKVKLDEDDGRVEYELEFYYENKEYDYELDAVSGEVLSYDHEIESKKSDAVASANAIGEDKAKEIALERAGLSADEVSGIHAEYDVDDGVAEYEVQFYVGRTEYDVTINAETGDIISYEEEQD